jgi:hypothetical protein
MPTPKRSLEIHEDLAFDRRQWRVQRVSWAVLAVLLLLGLLGVFGNGPLSDAVASDGALHVTYERFAHAQAPTTVNIRVSAPGTNPVRLAIDHRYLDALSIEHIRPPPLRAESRGDDDIFEFAAPSAGDLQVSLDGTPQEPGLPIAVIRLDGPSAARVGFRQVLYP